MTHATDPGRAAPAHTASLPDRWKDRRFLSWGLRAALLIGPILLAAWVYTALFDRPESLLAEFAYWMGAAVVAVAAGLGAERLAQRVVPLATLLRMPLAFPGPAPNRLRIALRRDPSAGRNADELDADDMAARNLVSLVGVLARHDRATRGHAERVQTYAALIGEELRLAEHEIDRLRWAALTHDVGKLSVPPEILAETGPLSADDRRALRDHPGAAAPYLFGLSDWLGEWWLAAVEHHERWDGGGYPRGLAGEQISLAARIVAVADAYDAMTSAQSYRPALRPTVAREQIARSTGTQFDPAVVRAMLAVPLERLRLVLGPLGWLKEFAWAVRLPPAPTAAAVTTVAAAIVGVGAVFALSDAPGSPDPEIEEQVLGETVDAGDTPNATDGATTTTAAPTTTTTLDETASTTTTPDEAPATTTTAPSTTTTAPPAPTTTAPAIVAGPTTTLAPPPPTLGPPPTTVPPTTTTTTPPSTTTTTTTSTTTTTTTTTTTLPPAPPEPNGTGFLVLDPATLPADLGDGQLPTNTRVFLWSEGVATIDEPITVRAFADRFPIAGDSVVIITLPEGTRVCPYLLHADPPGATPAFEVVVDFGVAPLGFALQTTDLEESAALAIADVDYRPEGLEPDDEITVTGTEIVFVVDGSDTSRDQVRIFLPC